MILRNRCNMEDNGSSTERVAKSRSSLEIDVISNFDLKNALRDEKSVIVIKDRCLSNETVLWMTFGQCLQHATLVTALGAIVCSSGMNDTLLQVAKPLAVGSLVMNVGYHVFWHHKPLNQYRIAQGPSIQNILNGNDRANTVIVRRVVQGSSVVHSFASVLAVVSAFWKEIRNFNITERIGNMLQKTEEKLDEQEPRIREATDKIKWAFRPSEI